MSEPVYRLYFLNEDNRISAAEELACSADDMALSQARQKSAGRAAELWDRTRLVARLGAVRIKSKERG